MRGRLAPMRVRPFGRLLASYTLNELGDSAGVVALAVLVFDRTHAVAPTVGFFVSAKFLPAFVAPPLTARLDQTSLRRTLPVIYVFEALAFGALALMARSGFHAGTFLALALLDGSLALTARGLTRGAVAGVLQPLDLLKEGNALLNVGFAVSSVGGAALAGIVIGQLGLPVALLLDAASFVAIAAVLATTSGLPQVHVGREPWLARFRAGLQFARASGPVRALLVGQSVALMCFTVVVPIDVIYAKKSLGATSTGYGMILASWGAGIVIGSLIYVGVRRRGALELILASTATIGVAYVGLATATEVVVACALSVLGGIGNGVQWIAVVTALQEATPTDLQARVAGLLESIAAAVPGLGYLLGGAIVALASPRAAYAIAGTGVLAIAFAGLLTRPTLTRPAETRQRPSTAPM